MIVRACRVIPGSSAREAGCFVVWVGGLRVWSYPPGHGGGSVGERSEDGAVLTPDPTGIQPLISPPRSLVGAIIGGKYRLRRVLGRGGMGTVYKAENVAIGRTVAVKVLHHHLADEGITIARFQREARAAASVGHDNIVDVLDMGVEPNGAPYTVMEYVRGKSLAAALRDDGAFEPERAAKIAGQVLAALAAAHGEGIIHRDLKPENVMLTAQGKNRDHVKLFDFGVAAIIDTAQDQRGPNDLTPSGKTMGTPTYATPEQILGDRVRDARVDLYAVGVLLYQMLAGRVPFDQTTFPELCRAITSEPPPWFVDIGLEIDPALEVVVRKALEKKADDRWQYAEEMGEALVPWGAEPPSEMADATDTLTMELRQLRAREIELWGGEQKPSSDARPLVSGAALLELTQFLRERFGEEMADEWISRREDLHTLVKGGLEPDQWYASPRPISVIEQIDREVGRGDRQLVAEAGRYLARRASELSDTRLEHKTLTPELLFSHVPDVWQHYFQLGDVQVVKLGRGYGRLEVGRLPDASLALNAAIAGYLDEALRIAGARDVDVRVEKASALGDDKDVYEATWSS